MHGRNTDDTHMMSLTKYTSQPALTHKRNNQQMRDTSRRNFAITAGGQDAALCATAAGTVVATAFGNEGADLPGVATRGAAYPRPYAESGAYSET